MPVSADTLALLMSKGLSGDDLIEVVRAIDADAPGQPMRTKRQERNARYYDKHKKAQASEQDAIKTPEQDAPVPPDGSPKNNNQTLPSPPPVLPDNPSDCLPRPGPTTPKRGHRLPADWTPPAEIVDFGVSVGFEASEIRGALLDEFRDYWCPLTGAKSTKLDWAATYRNRLREIAQRRKRTSAPRLAFSNSAQPPPYVSPFAVSKGPELSREEQLEIGRRFSEQWARK